MVLERPVGVKVCPAVHRAYRAVVIPGVGDGMVVGVRGVGVGVDSELPHALEPSWGEGVVGEQS